MTLAPVYFTVAGRYRSVVADATTDSNTDPEIGAVSATVTFQPLISSGDVILASQAAPRPTGFLAAPIVALIDPTDGLLKLRTTQDAGASGGLDYVPVRLLADTDVLELNGPLYYTVTFSDVVYNNGARGAINSFTFQAPNADLELDLITVATGPSQVAAGLTKVAPTGVRYDPSGSGSIIFTVSGVDIPSPIPVSVLRGPTGASGASGGTGGTGAVGATGAQGASGVPGASGIPGVSGIPGATGETGPVGATGASGASGGTGGTGLAGQSVSLKGSVATYSLLPGSATTGDAYVLLSDNLLYVYNSGWPAEGAGLPWVGPAGATGASGVPGATGATGATGASGGTGGTGGTGEQGASGIPGATGPTGPEGASGGTGGTGGTGGPGASGASGAGTTRSIQTVTANTTLGNASGTDYVVYSNIVTVPSSESGTALTVSALLLGNGTNNSTTITDSSLKASNFTASGNAKLSTGTKKYGTASISFDGTNSFISSSAATSNFAFGSSSDWTIEMWVYPTSLPAGAYTLYDGRSASGTVAPWIRLINSGALQFVHNGVDVFSANSLSAGQWAHVAYCRSGGTLRAFINGTQVGTKSDTFDYVCPAGVRIGARYDGAEYFNGFIDDIRIDKSARYTANFTAPTAELSDTYTFTPAVTPNLTLPSATSNANMYRVWNLNAEALALTPQSGQGIDGATGAISLTTGTKKLLINDGATGWRTW